jgi:hypothetical protein
MAKYNNPLMLDAALGYINDYISVGNVTCHLCTDQPATVADAVTNFGSGGYQLCSSTLGTSDGTIADNDTADGRKLTIAEQANLTINVDGTATHIALVENGSILLYVTTCASQALTNGNQVTVPAWVIDMRNAQ